MNKTSAVVITRNDNYGGHQALRFYHSICSLVDAFDEVVVVDWNQPDGLTLIDYTISQFPGLFPKEGRIKSIKVTPEDIEKTWPGLSKYPIVEVLARNIGLRRAKNDWILSTNPDCVISKSIPVHKLDQEIMYTCSRTEVPIDQFTRHTDTDELINELMQKEYPSKPRADIKSPWHGDVWSLIVCCGDFQFAHRRVWDCIKGFEEQFAGFGCGIDTNVMKKAYLLCDTSLIDSTNLIFHLEHGKGSDIPNEHPLPVFSKEEMIFDFIESSNSCNWGVPDLTFDTTII